VPGRVFVAIDLPSGTRDLVTRCTDAFVASDPSWAGEKLVAPGLLHVTLAFLGPVPDAALDSLLGRLSAAVAAAPPLELLLAHVRCVPSARRAAMLWVTLGGDLTGVEHLASGVAAAAGLDASDRPFAGHITLARARRPRPADPAACARADAVLFDSGREADRLMSVRAVTVFSSTLGPAGPSYERLAVLPLGGV
jgi:2'-5' RNA ligase